MLTSIFVRILSCLRLTDLSDRDMEKTLVTLNVARQQVYVLPTVRANADDRGSCRCAWCCPAVGPCQPTSSATAANKADGQFPEHKEVRHKYVALHRTETQPWHCCDCECFTRKCCNQSLRSIACQSSRQFRVSRCVRFIRKSRMAFQSTFYLLHGVMATIRNKVRRGL